MPKCGKRVRRAMERTPSPPVEEAVAAEVAAEAVAAEGAPTEGAPTEGAPTEGAPTESAPTEGAPTESALTEGALTKAAPPEGLLMALAVEGASLSNEDALNLLRGPGVLTDATILSILVCRAARDRAVVQAVVDRSHEVIGAVVDLNNAQGDTGGGAAGSSAGEGGSAKSEPKP
ncbi:hypothetical protein T484DRAFT_1755291 [Baffinella frigidus]|nr:hypothetical protein T484DRAFT_1755291 [Cryptophyta sp. CCMP2293]